MATKKSAKPPKRRSKKPAKTGVAKAKRRTRRPKPLPGYVQQVGRRVCVGGPGAKVLVGLRGADRKARGIVEVTGPLGVPLADTEVVIRFTSPAKAEAFFGHQFNCEEPTYIEVTSGVEWTSAGMTRAFAEALGRS